MKFTSPLLRSTLLPTLLSAFLVISAVLVTFHSNKIYAETTKPKIQQGVRYKKHINIKHYWISEKLDGMRGYWNGKQLLSRQGHIIATPIWFTKHWPNIAIDGELWLKRGSFQTLMSCVKKLTKQKSSSNCWRNIRFMMFDLPTHTGIFDQRVEAMEVLNNHHSSPYLAMIKQFKVSDNIALERALNAVIKVKGEGLMLHLGNSFYLAGRTADIMKLKKHQDAEATVIEHLNGQGKYTNMMGSIRVVTKEGITFKIGSGFSDYDRKNPPALGSIITFKYNGTTQAGIPRFARYYRERITD